MVIGHGTGQSNEAEHLLVHLPALHNRIVRTIVGDLTHMTIPQMAALARPALNFAGPTHHLSAH